MSERERREQRAKAEREGEVFLLQLTRLAQGQTSVTFDPEGRVYGVSFVLLQPDAPYHLSPAIRSLSVINSLTASGYILTTRKITPTFIYICLISPSLPQQLET